MIILLFALVLILAGLLVAWLLALIDSMMAVWREPEPEARATGGSFDLVPLNAARRIESEEIDEPPPRLRVLEIDRGVLREARCLDDDQEPALDELAVRRAHRNGRPT